jgi:hypothetical protein
MATATEPASTADLLSPTEAAALCGKSETTVSRYLKTGKLRYRLVLGRPRIARADVEALMAGEPAVASATKPKTKAKAKR